MSPETAPLLATSGANESRASAGADPPREASGVPARADRPGEVDWNGVWHAAWKPNVGNPWFAYQADVYAACWRGDECEDRDGASCGLKTDAFDEACGFHPLRALATDAPCVVMDVAPRIVHEALRAHGARPRLRGCATDVRALAFRAQTFEFVFSPSTLDHFSDARDIVTALAELGRVLKPGGRLLVTLDNPANPVLAVRRGVHRLLGPVGGVIPFRLGRTLSRARLVAALEQLGFEVRRSGYLVHTPRLVGLWLGEWAARTGRDALAARLRALFGVLERALDALPIRRWTGHFVFADCRRIEMPAVEAARADEAVDGAASDGGPSPRRTRRDRKLPAVLAPRGPGLLWRALSRYRVLEYRLRYAYLGVTPRPVLARVDPALRRGVTIARRALAAPLYLRQQLAVWSGRCGGDAVRVTTWGKRDDARRLFAVLFDEPPQVRWLGPCSLPEILRLPSDAGPERDEAAASDLVIAETTPALAAAFRRHGFFIVPGMVRMFVRPETARAVRAHPGNSLASDLRLMERAAYRTEVWSYTRARSLLFYHRYHVPHVRGRFDEEEAAVPSFRYSDHLFAAGFALALFAPGASVPAVIGVVVERGDMLVVAKLGTRDGDMDLVRTGGLSALYDAAIRIAHERAIRVIDIGQSLPWRMDGVTHYKWKWGFRPGEDLVQTLDYAVWMREATSPAARRLGERQVIVRDADAFRVLTRDGLVAVDDPAPASRRAARPRR